MKKSFYLSFASPNSLDEVRKYFYDKFDIEFNEHESSYVGEYLKYSGMYADVIKLLPNVMPTGDHLDRENGNIETIIEMSFVSGKNADKLSKYKYMKESIKRMNGTLIIKDETIEE